MHRYSLDAPHRRNVHVAIAVVSFVLPAVLANIASFIKLPYTVVYPLSFAATFGILYGAFDQYLWRISVVRRWHQVPDLNGKWHGEGRSSYIDPETGQNKTFSMTVRIRQTFSRIEVDTQTGESTSRSFMASLEVVHAVPIFRYAYENRPKNSANEELQRHPGMIDLRITDANTLEGDYFSGKHRLRFGCLTLTRAAK